MRIPAFVFALLCAAPLHGAPLVCTGSTPNWSATLRSDTATVNLRDRTGAYQIKLVTPAKNDPDTTAYTLIGATDTAILIVHPGRCNSLSQLAHLLTQDRSQAILLTGCCRTPSQ